MNDNESILAELRKISAWADLQRKVTRRSLLFLALFFPAMALFAFVVDHEVKTTLVQAETFPSTWYDVDREVHAGNYDRALKIGEELIRKTPQDPDAHRRLANAWTILSVIVVPALVRKSEKRGCEVHRDAARFCEAASGNAHPDF